MVCSKRNSPTGSSTVSENTQGARSCQFSYFFFTKPVYLFTFKTEYVEYVILSAFPKQPSGQALLFAWMYLTDRFHIAVHLSTNRSQMTSKCGKFKKVAREAIAECVTDVLTTFWRPLWSVTGQMHLNMESICFIMIITKQTTTNKTFQFISKSFSESRPLPTLASTKKAIWCNLRSIQNDAISLVAVRSKEFWLVQEYNATVKLVSLVASRGMKSHSDGRRTEKSTNLK